MVRFTKKQKQLINTELKRAKLETKKFVTIDKVKGRYFEIWKHKKTKKLESHPANIKRLKFKLKVAKSRL